MTLTASASEPNAERAWHPWLWVVLGGLLVLPILAMAFTREMNWGLEDVAAAALLLGGMGLLIELALKRVRSGRGRAIAVGLVVLLATLVWAELAVGIV
jgi:hypothetical protein